MPSLSVKPKSSALKILILGWVLVFLTTGTALAKNSYSDEDLQYLVVRYHGLRLANIINEHQLNFVIECLKNPEQKSLTHTLQWAQNESIDVKLDCTELKTRGPIEKARQNFSKMRHALILSQVSKSLFMIPDGEIASESLDADAELQISLNPSHPYGITAPANWLKSVYEPALFQISTLPPVSPEEKEYYRQLQNQYSLGFCHDFMKNLADYTEHYKKAPSILENTLPSNHPLLKDTSLCESFLLQRISVSERTDLNMREKKALTLLRKEYLKYSAARRQDLRLKSFQEYSNLIAAMPVLLFMDSAHLSDAQWINALEKIKANSDVRALVDLAQKEFQEVDRLADNLKDVATLSDVAKERLGDELWPLLQNPHGAKSALALLNRHFTDKSYLYAESATRLQQAWESDYTFKRYVRMVIASGVTGVCFIPASRVVSVATALILKRGCMAAAGLPINAAVFTYALTRYENRVAMLLSTFDESNSIIDMSLLSREKRAFIFAAMMMPIGNQTQALGETSKLLLQKVSLIK